MQKILLLYPLRIMYLKEIAYGEYTTNYTPGQINGCSRANVIPPDNHANVIPPDNHANAITH